MAQAMLSVRVDETDKKNFEEFCEETGMNVSVAINMYIKAVLREHRLPFDVRTDPFYSNENIERLKVSAEQIKNGNVISKNLDELKELLNE